MIAALVCSLMLAPAPSGAAAQERIPIELGPDQPGSSPPQQIDILAPPPAPDEPTAALIKACEDSREAGIVAGEIVVCRELQDDARQLYSGSRAEWLRRFAARTQGANTIPAPDVAGEGIFRGPATISGLCLIPPCPKDPALIVDVTAIPPPPEGSDAERVAQGLTPLEGDDAPLSGADRRRKEADLGLPPPPAAPPPEE